MQMPQSRRQPRGLIADTLRLMAIAAGLGALFGLAALGVGSARAQDLTHVRITAGSFGAVQHVPMAVNKSVIVDLPVDVQDVIVSRPEVANAILRSKRRVIVQSITAGDTNMFLIDAKGRTIAVLEISIKGEASTVAAALRETYKRILPAADLLVESVVLVDADGDETNRVVISGTAPTTDDVNKAIAVAAQFAGSEANVASLITVSGPQQVMLKVTVAEVQRESVKQLGINLNGSFTSGGITSSILSSQPLGGATNVISNNAIKAGFGIPGLFSIDATLRSLERRGALRTLAEPTLTAMSGSEAEFLAGGEFPVPTDVSDGVITFAFKEFGVKLKFTPLIKSSGAISLAVDTSVSEPTTEGGFTAGGVTIPATKERQAKTTVELEAGQTLSIGGLMQDSVRQQINRLPGLGDIPILGALFRSRDFIHSRSELVILVTPYFAEAGDKPVLPTDEMIIANDAEAIFLGRIESIYAVGPDGMRGSYDGSVGFVLD